MSLNIIIFKLNYSDSFEEIAQESLFNNFTLFNAITIYVPNQKHMYVWIGKKVSQCLKSHYPKIW